jgi:uncharacterized membrane protein
MSIRSALFILGILVGGAVLVAVGGFGAIMLLTGQQCGGSSYLYSNGRRRTCATRIRIALKNVHSAAACGFEV